MSKAVSRARKSAPRAALPARRPRKARTAAPAAPAGKAVSMPRGLVVGLLLFGGLGLTTGLLALLSPSPLAPDVFGTLFTTSNSVEPAFAGVPLQPGRWSAIYIRHSKTPAGDAATLAEMARQGGGSGPPDHFVVGNGDGLGDGEVQVTRLWAEQLPGAPPAPGERVDAGWVSICLIGDFDRNRPTEAQRRSLNQLVASLQERLDLPADRLIHLDRPNSAAGIGRRFSE